MIKGILVTTENEIKEVTVDSYKDIQLLVGGYIEAVRFGMKDYFCYANDEAKIWEMPENELATKLWYDSGQRILLGDYIAGNVVFFREIQMDDDIMDINEDFINNFDKYINKVKG